jgi:hypothetical protein
MSEGVPAGAARVRSVARRLRPIGIGGLAAVVLVVLVMGTAAAAPAITAGTTTKYVAPYTGLGFGGLANLESGCGSTAAVSALPTFNTTNGVGTFAAKTTSKNCGTTPSNRTLELTLEYIGPAFTTTSGSHNVTPAWVLTFSAKLAASGATGKLAESIFEVLATTFLEDTTNGTNVRIATLVPAYDEITTGSYSHTFSKLSAKPSAVATLKKGHDYEFQVEIVVILGTEVAPGATSASASVTMSGGSDGAKLASVTVA